MNTLKVKSSFPKAVEALGDAELGRLFRGMMRYAFSGTAPELPGAERIVWPTVKADIDGQGFAYEARCKSVENARGFILDRNQSENSLISDRKQSDFSLQRQEEDKGEKGKEKSRPPAPPVKEKSLKEGTEEEKKSVCVNKTTRAKTPTDEAFDAFWAVYPRKVGKGAARKSFDKLPREVWPKLVPAVEAQKQSRQWQRDGGQFVPHPATWLNQGRWDDEPESATQGLKPNEIHGSAGRGPIDMDKFNADLAALDKI